jgi:hypothetical protein
LSDEFTEASGQYFDNDSGRFAATHPEDLNVNKLASLESELNALIMH